MILRKGEELLLKEEKISAEFETTTGKKIAKQKGDLFLTNQRLVFEAVGGGLFSKKRTTAIDCELDEIRNVSIEGFLGKKLVLELPVIVNPEYQAEFTTAAAFKVLSNAECCSALRILPNGRKG
jgi:hypothetical protein